MIVPHTATAGTVKSIRHDDGRIWHRRRATSEQQKKQLVVVLLIGILLLALSVLLYFFTRWHLARKRRQAVFAGTRPRKPARAAALRFRLPWSRLARGEYVEQRQDDNPLALAPTASPAVPRDADVEVSHLDRVDSQSSRVNRNTSLRSIMTLPAYSPSAGETEQIIAREGERGGMDTVVEFPETADEEELRREEEMESLYQIRRARRQENADREERRRLRRDARDRGDYAALSALRASDRAATAAQQDDPTHSAALIAAHQTVNRERRVSSVQYGNLGVVAHDGSRVRSHSAGSDRRPLLNEATGFVETHHRGRSASSVLTVSTMGSDELLGAASPRPWGGSEFEMVAVGRGRSGTGSTTAAAGFGDADGDLADQPMPTLDPPMYEEAFEAVPLEEAPPYESPVRTRAPQLPQLERLPSIRVTESLSPVTPPVGTDGRL